jgi:hypothetical protein
MAAPVHPTKFEILVGRFWNAFGTGAQMPVSDKCVGKAYELGYYNNVTNRIDRFDETVTKASSMCCVKAGRIAALLAKEAGRDEIGEVEFAAAAKYVEDLQRRIGERADRRRGEEPSGNYGEICSTAS